MDRCHERWDEINGRLTFGILSNCLREWNKFVVNGFLKPNGIRKVILKDIKRV